MFWYPTVIAGGVPGVTVALLMFTNVLSYDAVPMGPSPTPGAPFE